MNKKVLVIFGGMSSEHSVSCVSASYVLENMDRNKYEVSVVGIDKDGIWYKYSGNIDEMRENKWLENGKIEKINDIFSEIKKVDVVFPVLHGKYGEDGKIQGIFELCKTKYVGCKVLGSAIAMDKVLSKKLVETINIPVVEYVYLNKKEFEDILLNKDKEDSYINFVKDKLAFPLIVKPNKEGSSYGIVKVEDEMSLKEAIKFSFKYDDEILIEKYLDNRHEVECAIIENSSFEDKIYSSTPGEIVSANELYDFDAKYDNNKSYVKIPAEISEENIMKIKEYSKKIFKVLKLSSLSRVDFFISNNKIYFNEVNTLPGFTSISMYPKMLINDGISYSKIIDILIQNA